MDNRCFYWELGKEDKRNVLHIDKYIIDKMEEDNDINIFLSNTLNHYYVKKQLISRDFIIEKDNINVIKKWVNKKFKIKLEKEKD